MNRGRRLCAGVLAGLLVLALVPVGARAAAPVFADVPEGHWARPYVEQAWADGAVNGTWSDGTTRRYSPEEKLELAQWLAICTRRCWPEEAAEAPAGDSWYSPDLAVARDHGLLTGLETVPLTEPLSRYDMAVSIRNLAGAAGCSQPHQWELATAAARTGDLDLIPADCREAALFAVASGLITGVDGEGRFAGETAFTRAQAAAVYCRLDDMLDCGNRRSIPLGEAGAAFDPAELPEFSGTAGTAVHDNVPYFTAADLTAVSYETYGSLDDLGRCTGAWASIGPDLMPTEERGPIGMVKPTGWHTVKYDCIPDRYLYNRCHLIGYQLTGENATAENLITGTRYLNMEGMLPLENEVADYIRETGSHVLYRVTPVFQGGDLVASGVLMEAYSVEDLGRGICSCIYAWNVQPGVVIDYAAGDSRAAGEQPAPQPVPEPIPGTELPPDQGGEPDYVLNVDSQVFHRPDCRYVKKMKEANRLDWTGRREQLLEQGYRPCQVCDP